MLKRKRGWRSEEQNKYIGKAEEGRREQKKSAKRVQAKPEFLILGWEISGDLKVEVGERGV